MSMPRQPYLARKTSVGAAVSTVLDCGDWPLEVIEVFVKSDGAATFTVYGSATALAGEWRKTDEIAVNAGGSFEKHKGYANAYRFIKVECLSAGNHLVEIVGAS